VTTTDPARRKRIAQLTIDDPVRVRLSPSVEQERRVALFDLLQENQFALVGDDGGPYVVHLTVEEMRRIRFRITDERERELASFPMPLAGLQTLIKDYFMICDSYFSAIKTMPASRIEAIDMARRGLHNEGAELLMEGVADKVTMDKATARRLFTLICVMHIRG
jgi:Uncharacterized protein conserved in bacteria